MSTYQTAAWDVAQDTQFVSMIALAAEVKKFGAQVKSKFVDGDNPMWKTRYNWNGKLVDIEEDSSPVSLVVWNKTTKTGQTFFEDSVINLATI